MYLSYKTFSSQSPYADQQFFCPLSNNNVSAMSKTVLEILPSSFFRLPFFPAVTKNEQRSRFFPRLTSSVLRLVFSFELLNR